MVHNIELACIDEIKLTFSIEITNYVHAERLTVFVHLCLLGPCKITPRFGTQGNQRYEYTIFIVRHVLFRLSEINLKNK